MPKVYNLTPSPSAGKTFRVAVPAAGGGGGEQTLVTQADWTHIGSFTPPFGRTTLSSGQAVISSNVGSEGIVLPEDGLPVGAGIMFEVTTGPNVGTVWNMFRDDGPGGGGHQYALFPGGLPDLAGQTYLLYRKYGSNYIGAGAGYLGLACRRVNGQFRLTTGTTTDTGTNQCGLVYEFLPPADEDLSHDPDDLPVGEHVWTWPDNTAGDAAYWVWTGNNELVAGPGSNWGGDNQPRSLSWVNDTTLFYSYGGDYQVAARSPSFLKLVLASADSTAPFTRYGPYRMRTAGNDVISYKRACGPVIRVPQAWADAHLGAAGSPRYAVTGGGYFSLFGQQGGTAGIALTTIAEPPNTAYDYTGPDDGVTNIPPITGTKILDYGSDGPTSMRRPAGAVVRNYYQRYADIDGCQFARPARVFTLSGTWEAGDVIRVQAGADTFDFPVTQTDVSFIAFEFQDAFNALTAGAYPTLATLYAGTLYPSLPSPDLILFGRTNGVSVTATMTPLESGGGAADDQRIDGGTGASSGSDRHVLALPLGAGSTYNDSYKNLKVAMTGGPASGESRTASQHSGIGFDASPGGESIVLTDSAFSATPDPDDPFLLYEGEVQAATANTVTLQTAPLVAVAGTFLKIVSGTGVGQEERKLTLISGLQYSVSPAWTTTPAAGDKYRFYALGFAMTDPMVPGEDYMYWVHGDQMPNAFLVDTDTKKGWVFPCTLGYADQWYDRSAHRGRGIDNVWFVIDPDQLAQVIDEEILPHELVPTWFRPQHVNLAQQTVDGYLGVGAPHPASPGINEQGYTTWCDVRGACFDPVAKRAYVMEIPLERIPYGFRCHVYQLAD